MPTARDWLNAHTRLRDCSACRLPDWNAVANLVHLSHLQSVPGSRSMLRVPSLLRLAALAGAAALLTGCETTGSQPTAGLFSPMTHRRASAECWMETEKTAQSMKLDK